MVLVHAPSARPVLTHTPTLLQAHAVQNMGDREAVVQVQVSP